LLTTAAARIGLPNHEAIAAAKAGVIGLMQSAAATYASRAIRINAVAPGFIASEMTDAIPAGILDEVKKAIPAKRVGNPEDVAAAVLFLASADAGYISGQTIVVDGGMTG
jgi:3-oxoacyl-[acyl-carrier protein] reductase